MRFLRFALLLLGGLLARPALAQTDVIIRNDGTEIPAKVLVITPTQLRYRAPGGADTLRLAVADVFMVRYANGTREVLQPATPTAYGTDLLPGLSNQQRQELGRQAAARGYTSQGPFWGSLGATLYFGPLLGVVAPAVIAPHAIDASHLGAAKPELLADPTYGEAYRTEAQRRKRGRAWGGYLTGTGAWVALIAVLVAGNY